MDPSVDGDETAKTSTVAERSGPFPRRRELAPGAIVGRYVVVQPLGEGGMGAVLLAYDTQLARRVALKLLRTEAASPSARLRMLREAQAQARLAHPNVVPIFDVGEHEGDIFLAMEYVEGETLSDWLRTPRGWREIVAVMREAGRGLAAAHAAGIVHRDFKPANVLIGADGRARVLDFGIARAEATTDSGGDDARGAPLDVGQGVVPPSPGSSGQLLSDKLTAEGVVVGTLGYLAPEQGTRQAADVRSDVFSFSAALWRALYGTLPFPTTSVREYIDAVQAGPRERPKATKVPAWLHAVLLRGLRAEPAERFASMRELLAALDADPSRRRWLQIALACVVVATATVVGVAVRRAQAVRAACQAEGGAVAADWNGARRDATERALARAGDPFAEERATRVVRALDAYEGAWRDARAGACSAARIEKTESSRDEEVRATCLVGAREELEVAVELLSSGDPETSRRGIEIAENLTPPRLCTARGAQASYAPLPSEPGARAKAEEARRATVRAGVLVWSGRHKDALAEARRAAALAREAGDATGEAQALLRGALAESSLYEPEGAIADAKQAFLLAERAGADGVGAYAAAKLTYELGVRLGKTDEGYGWLEIAEAKLARHGPDEDLTLFVLSNRAAIEQARGGPREALADYVKLQDALTRRFGAKSMRTCDIMNGRGTALFELERYDEASAMFRDALACTEEAEGPESADLGGLYDNYADTLVITGHVEDALDAYVRAARFRAMLGEDDPFLVVVYGSLGAAEDRLGRFGAAEEHARRGVAVAGAREVTEAYLPIALYALGVARLGQKDAAAAKDACARAVEIGDAHDPPKPEGVYEYDALRCLGEAELALGHATEARAPLERSVSLVRRRFPGDLALARFALARALATGAARDEARASALADDAAKELREAAPAHHELEARLSEIDRWRAQRATATR